MVVGSMRMPEKPSLLASWMNAKRGSVGSKVCPGASRGTATFHLPLPYNQHVVSDMAAREIESVREREKERKSARVCARIFTAFSSCFAAGLEAYLANAHTRFSLPLRAQTSNVEKQNQGRSIDLDGTNSGNVLYIVTFYSQYTWAMTLGNFGQENAVRG
jgi:hypothetical protein